MLLDLGNVVFGIDFHRVFNNWANNAQVDKQRFYDAWALNDAYKAHEVNQITFARYTEALTEMFQINLSEDQWRAGWNDIWTQPFQRVLAQLPDVAQRHRLFAFSNTNTTHVEYWQNRYQAELSVFEEVFTSCELGQRKPDVAAYQEVCRRMGANPEEVIFLDDTEENVVGAKAAGINAEHVTSEDQIVKILSTL